MSGTTRKLISHVGQDFREINTPYFRTVPKTTNSFTVRTSYFGT